MAFPCKDDIVCREHQNWHLFCNPCRRNPQRHFPIADYYIDQYGFQAGGLLSGKSVLVDWIEAHAVDLEIDRLHPAFTWCGNCLFACLARLSPEKRDRMIEAMLSESGIAGEANRMARVAGMMSSAEVAFLCGDLNLHACRNAYDNLSGLCGVVIESWLTGKGVPHAVVVEFSEGPLSFLWTGIRK